MPTPATGQDSTVPFSHDELCLTEHERAVWPIDNDVKPEVFLWLSAKSGTSTDRTTIGGRLSICISFARSSAVLRDTSIRFN